MCHLVANLSILLLALLSKPASLPLHMFPSSSGEIRLIEAKLDAMPQMVLPMQLIHGDLHYDVSTGTGERGAGTAMAGTMRGGWVLLRNSVQSSERRV